MTNAGLLNPAWRPIGLSPRLQKASAGELRKVALITLLHLPLGIALYNAGALGILHPLAAFFIGMRWALNKTVPAERVAFAAAYIVGAEVLWRMAQVPIFWEFGKYGATVILITCMIKRGRLSFPPLLLIYLGALVPACILTLIQFDPAVARSILSSNMSGPLLLFVSGSFFSKIKVTPDAIRRLLYALIIPLICVACTTLFYTVTAEKIEFNTESNFATSGGFGPNQVSSMLGLGVFLTVAGLLIFKNSLAGKLYYIAAAILLAAQSLLTFSRGGIYNAGAGILVIVFLGSPSAKEAFKRTAVTAVLVAAFIVFVFPSLNDFTGGQLQERFEETNTSRRGDIAATDWLIFLENPVLGVGVGSAYSYRERFLNYKAMSHTEFSRLIAEHGMFGVIVLLTFIAMAVTNLRRHQSKVGKALVAGAMAWSIMFMLNGATRLGAPAFVWGMSFIAVADARTRRKKTLAATAKPAAAARQSSARPEAATAG